MSYTKTTWRNNQAPAINADNLNHMEQGIESAHNQIDVNTSNIESLTTQVQNNATNIASEISARQTTDSSLQSQIDQLVAPTGEAPNPAEIENARIGADGVTYDTLGNAIRTQFTDLKSALTQAVAFEETTETTTVAATWEYGLLSPNGSVSESSSYIYSNKIAVNVGDSVVLRKNDGDDTALVTSGVRLCAYNGNAPVSASGKSNNFNFPVVIGDGVTHIAITISAAYLSKNVEYEITRSTIVATPKSYYKSETYSKSEVEDLIEAIGAVKTVNSIEPDENGNIDISPEDHLLLVTQVQQITNIQKNVIESQIDVVDSARNAANHGVLPSNDGTTNFTNLQSLLDVGGTIVVDVPGVYEINGMLKIGSDTELIFGKQVYMKQMNNTGGFIVNVGAATNTYNENIAIKGLNLICNGKTGDSSTYRFGLRGKIGFGWVKNLTLSNIYVDDIPSATYFIHLAEYDNVLIEHCHIEGNKDGIHSAGGKGLTIRDCCFNTTDDPIALNCQDYFSSIPHYSWIKDVLIENCVDASPSGEGGSPRARSILFYGGAWLDWESGNTYRNGDTVVASNDCVYRLYSTTAISDETAIESTVEPSHSAGSVTESDGCTWRYIQDTPIYNVACENVTIRNFTVKVSRSEVFKFHNDNSQYVRSIYPNAIMPCHRNVVFDSIAIAESVPANYFIGTHEPVDTLRVLNSLIYATYIFRIQGDYGLSDANNLMSISALGNDFRRDGNSMVLVTLNQTGKTVNVKTYGNYRNASMGNSVTNGTCNMLANDLF